MLQQNSGGRNEAKNSGSGRSENAAAAARPFPLVDFIARWRHGNAGTGAETEMYLDEEAPSSPLLPNRKRKSTPTTTSGNDAEGDLFMPYPAPSAFLEPPMGGSRSRSLQSSTSELNNVIKADEKVDVDIDDYDDDDDDQQSIKSYDGTRISSYDNRSLRQQEVQSRSDDVQPEPENPEQKKLLSNFFAEAGRFLSDQLHGDKSRTRLKESTEMKNLRWENFQIFYKYFDNDRLFEN